MAVSLRPQAQAVLAAIRAPGNQPGAGLSSYAGLMRTKPGAQQGDQPELPDPETRRKAFIGIYGPAFPLALDAPTPDDWARWPEVLWDQHRDGVADAVHLGERNRRFYLGDQWISSGSGSRGPWREPPMPKNQLRLVDNRVKPALDWRLQVVTEQRPGFRFEPTDVDPDDRRRTEAKQRGVEYQWHQQRMQLVLKEAAFWSALHGVSFLYSYWDPNLGPWDEIMPGERTPLGDIATRVFRIDQVRVSANATSTVKPHYWVIREEIPLAQAILEHGENVVDADVAGDFSRDMTSWLGSRTTWNTAAPLFRSQRTVARFMVFCEKSDYLPGGCQMVVVGKKLVWGPKPLVIGRVPLARMTDGSPDPRFYPRPFFADWVAAQTQINKLQSMWFQSIRLNAGGRIYTKPDALAGETLVGGMLSMVEVRTAGSLSDSIMPADGFSVGEDVKEALQIAVKRLEDMTGWNDTARGQLTGDPSGRAVLAIREQLERVFAPPVAAEAQACSEWAEIQVAWMRWGYKMPRAVGIVGKSRPDLGRMLVSEDLDGAAACHVNPETMMPQPTSLRLYQLDQMYDKQIIDGREYRRRSPFADTMNIETPDDLQEAKAKRVCEGLRLGIEPEPMSWIDDEAIHQDVLQHEIMLAPNLDERVKAAAMQRWIALANQAAEKQQGMTSPPPGSPDGPPAQTAPGAPGGAADAGASSAFAPTPETSPIAGANPSTAAAPASIIPSMASATAPGSPTQQFEAGAPQ